MFYFTLFSFTQIPLPAGKHILPSSFPFMRIPSSKRTGLGRNPQTQAENKFWPCSHSFLLRHSCVLALQQDHGHHLQGLPKNIWHMSWHVITHPPAVASKEGGRGGELQVPGCRGGVLEAAPRCLNFIFKEKMHFFDFSLVHWYDYIYEVAPHTRERERER